MNGVPVRNVVMVITWKVNNVTHVCMVASNVGMQIHVTNVLKDISKKMDNVRHVWWVVITVGI